MRQKPGDGLASLERIGEQIEQRLFVRLPVGTEERNLKDIYEDFGEITECKVVNGKGCGFVGFTCWGHAHRALVETDGRISMPVPDGTKSQVLNVAFAERKRGGGAPYSATPLAKGLDNSRIFVGGLPQDCSEEDLRSLFEKYGYIKSASVIRSTGKSRGSRCAFVTFSLWGEALDAIAGVDNTRFPDNRDDEDAPYLAVVLAEPPPDGAHKGDANGSMVPLADPVFAYEKRRAATPGGQRSEWEKLKAAYLETLESRSTREACDELHNALMAMRPSVIQGSSAPQMRPMATAGRVVPPPRSGAGPGGRGLSSLLGNALRPPKLVPPPASRLTPAGAPAGSRPGSPAPFSFKGGSRPQGAAADARVFVSSLPPECSEEELQSLVEQISPELETPSELLECRVLTNKGCGYLRWAKWQTAQEAIEALDERQVTGWPKALRAKWAAPKEPGKGTGVTVGGGSSNTSSRAASHPPAQNAAETDDRSGRQTARRSLSRSPPWKRRRSRSPSVQSDESSTSCPARRRCSPMERERSRSRDRTLTGLDSTRLFIGMLQRHVGLDKVKRVFEEYGEIEDARYIEDKGVAYITYADPAAAQKAIDELHERDMPGLSRGSALNVQLAKKR